MVTQIDILKYENTVQKVKIYVANRKDPKNQMIIQAGQGRAGKLLRIKVPEEYIKSKKRVPIMFTGSYVDGYPFPTLLDIGLKHLVLDDFNKLHFKNMEPEEDTEGGMPRVSMAMASFHIGAGTNQSNLNNSFSKQSTNDLVFFDPVKKYRDNFVRLTEIKVFFEWKPINSNKLEKA